VKMFIVATVILEIQINPNSTNASALLCHMKWTVVANVVTIQPVELIDLVLANSPAPARHGRMSSLLTLRLPAETLLIIILIIAGTVEKLKKLRSRHPVFYL